MNYRRVSTIAFLCGLFFQAHSQCSKYQIFANDSVGCENDIFSFRVHPAAPSGSIYNWDFEVKTVSNDAKPTVAFTNSDTLTVSVEIKLPSSQTCTIERKNYIKIGSKPKVNKVFVSDKELCNTGIDAKLTVAAPTAKKHKWSVEGSVYSGSASTITHKFTRTGYASIQIISEGVFGCSTKKIFDSVLFVEKKPTVTFPYTDTSLCGASSIKLQPNFNYFGQNKFKYSWVFQGASPLSSNQDKPPLINYPSQKATYDVSLSLSSQITSCTHNYSFDDLVKVENVPTISIKASPLNGIACKSENFGIKVKVNGLDSSKLKFSHKSGDSIKIVRISADSIMVFGKKEGSYTIYATYGFNSCTKQIATTIKVEMSDVNASMDKSLPCICNIPTNIFIANKSVHFNGKSMKYEWLLKNKKGKILANSTDTNFRWRADRYGEFELQLKATDLDGCFDLDYYVFKARPLQVEFEISPSTACPKTAINFKLADTLCYSELDSVKWTFYELDNSVRRRYKGEDAVEKYQDTGWYAVKVEVLTKEGCRDSLRKDSAVHIIELKAIEAEVPKGPFCIGDLVKMKYSVKPKDMAGDWYGVLSNKDTTIYTQKGDSIIFKPPLPGTYDIKVVFTTEECTDSIVFTDALEVGGVIFDFTPKATTGCLPFSTTLNTNIIENVLIGTNDKSLNYEWHISPKKNGAFDDNTKQNPSLTVTEKGALTVILTIENAQGCFTKLTKTNLFNFNLKADFSLPDSFCAGLKYPVVNKSSGAIDSLRWTSSNPNFRALPYDSCFSPVLVFEKAGKYEVNLLVKSNTGCEEKVTRTIEIIDFGFDFSINDTTAKCSPAPFEFSSTGVNVDSFIWDYDDGSAPFVTANTFNFKIYDLTRITPYRNKFDVKLYAVNNIGCVDSIIEKEILTVRGPVPIFEFDNNLGCEPLQVDFINKSINAKRIYFDFDDNSSVDSVNYDKHTYQIVADTQELQVYRPFVVVKDNYDCQFSYRTPDSIVVYTKPTANFELSKSKGCDPETIRFKDTSLFAYKWHWYFGDGDSTADSTSITRHTYTIGKYLPTLIVENAIGCRDSMVFNKLKIFEPPMAHFNPDENFTCVGRNVEFMDSSITKYLITQWKWDFGDTLIMSDTSTSQNPKYAYNREDVYDVSLIVIDSNGCSDTLIAKNILEIFTKLQVDTPQILFASVWNDMGVELETSLADKSTFAFYELQEVETLNDTILNIFKRKDTTHLINGLNPDANRYCFRLEMIDKCDFRHPSDTHCTILLNVDKTKKEATNLNWSPYIGWKNLKNYSIHRGLKGQALFPIATVPASQLSYIDSSVCDELYEYKVVATKEEDSLTSYSNGIDYQPEYIFQVNPLEMNLATVQNERVVVNWEKSIQRNVKHYAIDRKAKDNAWIKEWKFLTDTFLIDSIAKTQVNYYIYRVRAIDACDYNSKMSLIAKSILLSADATDRDFVLNWNPYKEWAKGVKEYVLQRRAPFSSQFINIAQLSPSDTFFLDTSAFLQFEDPFAYRVFAVENVEEPDTSYSNIRVVYPLPTLFVPNAFTPNGDGLNEIFNFKSFGLLPDSMESKGYEMRIYNRWGQEVFRTNAYSVGWDGTFKGQDCEIGSYVFLLKAQAKNGDLIFRKGGIMLLR